MTSDETQIQIPANWPMSHAKRVTRDNWKNPEYHVAAAIRYLRTDTNCPAGKSWPNHVKKMSSISDLKRPRAQRILDSKHDDAKDCKGKCCFYRSCVHRHHFRLRSFASSCLLFGIGQGDAKVKQHDSRGSPITVSRGNEFKRFCLQSAPLCLFKCECPLKHEKRL